MTSTAVLSIRDLRAEVAGKPILRGVNLEIAPGEVHALMGPNGSGKSTLSSVLMGHPGYTVTGGEVWLQGESMLDLPPEERSRRGLFLSFQHPVAVPGVTLAQFLKAALDAHRGPGVVKAGEFLKRLRADAAFLELEAAFINRAVNDGFSGGERKRIEILQMLTLEPAMAILDEADSGLDIDALQIVAKGVNRLLDAERGLLVITHYERILKFIRPHHLHILMDGAIVKSGGPELVRELESRGYDWLREKPAAEEAPA
jgi:Fe-S cluster assembly ATP-binding protein